MDTLLFDADALPVCPPPPGGCARPIGRRNATARPRRAPKVHQLVELRRVMIERFDEVLAELRCLRQERRDAYEVPAALMRRLVVVERELGLVEVPTAPRIRRRRPLE